MWYVFQLLIFIAVMFANIHWQWTPNGYLASLIGIGTAFATTWLLLKLLDGLRLLSDARRLRRAKQQRPAERFIHRDALR